MNGYIKLFRKLRNWKWYGVPCVKDVFIHLLITANIKDNYYKGTLVRRGQVIVGLQSLANELGYSVQNIRTALEKLKVTNEITSETTNKGTLITVINWELYQGNTVDTNKQSNKRPNNQLTNDQQTTNKRVTIDQQTTNNSLRRIKNTKNTKNTKEEKEYKERKYSNDSKSVLDYLNFRIGSKYRYSDSSLKSIQARLNDGYTVNDCKTVIDKKCVDWLDTEWSKYLVPGTLFGNKFEKYLNQKINIKKNNNVIHEVPLPAYMQNEAEKTIGDLFDEYIGNGETND